MAQPRAVDLVGRKRDGGVLTRSELEWLVRGYLDGGVGEGQMGALLMAGVLRGFSDDEAIALTNVLLDSGATLDLSSLPGPTFDKHSTGGVGDATTLLVAPLLASAGVFLVKLSGRGLGHTGGTLDKLESIPGLRTVLSRDELLAVAEKVGCVVAAQSDELVPADRELYALRDITGTVASPALIASSVMSKKLAAGAQNIVLDVKVGDGAFLRSVEDGRALAQLCVRIASESGRRCAALVTAMDQPLGRGIGNALEVREAVDLLQAAPPQASRLAMLALDLAAHALVIAGVDTDLAAGRARLRELWSSGTALERLRRMISAQGGDAAVCDDPARVLPAAPVTLQARAVTAGTVIAVPARAIGELAARLGAGRARKGDAVDPAVGLDLRVEVGDTVERDQPLAVVHARTRATAEDAARRLAALIVVGGERRTAPLTVLDVVAA